MQTITYFSIHDYNDNYILSYKYIHNNKINRNEIIQLGNDNKRLETVFNENRNRIMDYVIKEHEYSKPLTFPYYFSPDGLHQANYKSTATITIDKVRIILWIS